MFSLRHASLFFFCLGLALICQTSSASHVLRELQDETPINRRKRHLKQKKKAWNSPSGKGAPSAPGSKKVKAPGSNKARAPATPVAPAFSASKKKKSSKRRA